MRFVFFDGTDVDGDDVVGGGFDVADVVRLVEDADFRMRNNLLK